MTENRKRFRIEFTVDAEGWSDKFIKDSAIQELTCMVPYPEDITFSEANPWHTGTPTEEGDYLLVLKAPNGKPHYFPNTLNKGKKWRYVFRGAIIAYQKIEPYKEKDNGSDN